MGIISFLLHVYRFADGDYQILTDHKTNNLACNDVIYWGRGAGFYFTVWNQEIGKSLICFNSVATVLGITIFSQ